MNKIEVRKIIKDSVELYERLDEAYDFHFNHCGSYMKVEVIGVMPKRFCMRVEKPRKTSFEYLAEILRNVGSRIYYIVGCLDSEEINNIRNLMLEVDKIDSIEFHKRIDTYKRGELKKRVLYIREMLNRS